MASLIYLRAFRAALVAVTFTVSLCAAEPACDVTRINKFPGSCNNTGWVQDPINLAKTTAATVKSCWQNCASRTECRSFRWLEHSKICYLYERYIEDMAPDYFNFQPGRLYDRDCFSTSCTLISTCKAVSSCEYEYVKTSYSHNTYDRFACAYGHTAHFPEHFHVYPIKYLNGSLHPCEVIRACAAPGPGGPFVVYYDLVKENWSCVSFNLHIDSYGADTQREHVTRNTFSVQNASVGRGYGYWLEDVAYSG